MANVTPSEPHGSSLSDGASPSPADRAGLSPADSAGLSLSKSAGPSLSDLAGPPPAGSPIPAVVLHLAAAPGRGGRGRLQLRREFAPTETDPVPIEPAEIQQVAIEPVEIEPVEIQPVWRNGLGGLTYRLVTPSGSRYVKWSPPGAEDLSVEADRLSWAGRFSPVPHVLDAGADDSGSWLLTAALAGRSAVESPWRERPAATALAIGSGLRQLHDALPVDECPWTWSIEDRVAAAHAAGGLDPQRDRRLAALLRSSPPADLVVCHGDACAPNTLIGDDGSWAGHVDVGSLGVADRWADLAVAAWSTEWNYGPGFAELVYNGYGIEPDRQKIEFYRYLWDET